MAAALGWRAAFLLEAAAMLPFVAFCLRAPAIDIRGTHAKQHVQQGGDGDSDGGSRAVAGGAAAALHGRRGRGEEGRLLEGHGPLSSAEDQDGQAHVPAGKSRWAQRLRAGAAAVWADLRQLAAHPVYVLAVGEQRCPGCRASQLQDGSQGAGIALQAAPGQQGSSQHAGALCWCIQPTRVLPACSRHSAWQPSRAAAVHAPLKNALPTT